MEGNLAKSARGFWHFGLFFDLFDPPQCEKMLSAFDLGRIKQEWLRTHNISAVAQATAFSRRAIKAAVDRNFCVATRLKGPSPVIKRRRRLLLTLVKKTSSKGHLKWPTYSSSEQLRVALATTSEFNVSKRQIRRDLHAMGYHPYIRPQHPTRRRADAVKRAAFAKKYKRTCWKKIVFSDESWLCCNERTGRVHWCRRRCEVLAIEKKARWNVPSVMVWGCIGHGYKSELVIFPSKHVVDGESRQFRLDAKMYVNRCLRTVSRQLRGRLFQQDNARAHSAQHTVRYLKGRGVELLEGWPAYSPDLNAIERIWKELHQRVGARCPLSMEELITVTREEWNKLPQGVIDAHCKHFSTQLRDL
jgi:transposase